MAVYNNGKGARSTYGLRVDRAGAVLPATGNQTLFTVAGGRVMVTNLVGEQTVVGSATATNLKLTAVPTAGASADLCSNTAVASVAVGTLYSPTAIGSAMQTGGAVTQNNEVIVAPGIIRATTDATNTGAIKWTLFYIPLDDGATVVAS